MNPTDADIRSALERRLSALDDSVRRRARILKMIEDEEEPRMKRKLSLGLALAIVMALVFVTVALALTTNLFSFFGRQDERYDKVAGKAELVATEPLAIEDDTFGAINAMFESALYDGMTLNVAMLIDRQTFVEEYAPDEEALKSMEALAKLPAYYLDEGLEEWERALNKLQAAIEAGAPYGFRVVRYGPSDNVLTDDGVEIPPYTGDPRIDELGRYVEMREFESPLPDELRNLDAITLNCEIGRYEQRLYFDGETLYRQNTSQKVGVMRATVARSKGMVINMRGSREISGIEITASAEVSAMNAVVTLKGACALGDLFGADAAIPEEVDPSDIWIDIVAYDEQGRKYPGTTYFPDFNQALPVTQAMLGVGELPERLEIHVRIEWEGDESNVEPFVITIE